MRTSHLYMKNYEIANLLMWGRRRLGYSPRLAAMALCCSEPRVRELEDGYADITMTTIYHAVNAGIISREHAMYAIFGPDHRDPHYQQPDNLYSLSEKITYTPVPACVGDPE